MSAVLPLIHLPHIINIKIATIHHDTMTTAGVVLDIRMYCTINVKLESSNESLETDTLVREREASTPLMPKHMNWTQS
jgi:hypothetical protein